MQFKVMTEGSNRLGLAEACQAFADAQWVPAHYTAEEAAEFILNQFRLAVLSELELLQVTCNI